MAIIGWICLSSVAPFHRIASGRTLGCLWGIDSLVRRGFDCEPPVEVGWFRG